MASRSVRSARLTPARRLYFAFPLIAAVICCLAWPGTAAAVDDPAWWTDPDTKIFSGAPQNNQNWAPINTGQLKHVASQANRYLDSVLLDGGGSGQAVDIICQFTHLDNHAPANVGQLKNVAKPFYDRLYAIGYNWQTRAYGATPPKYPWSGTTHPDNAAPASLGQLKNLFSFELSSDFLTTDTDADGLHDWWECAFFEGLTETTGAADFDGDGVINAEELAQGTNPKTPDTDGDGETDLQDVEFTSPKITLEVRFLSTKSTWTKHPGSFSSMRSVRSYNPDKKVEYGEWIENSALPADPLIAYNRSGIPIAALADPPVKPTSWGTVLRKFLHGSQSEQRVSQYYGGGFIIRSVTREEARIGLRLKSDRPCQREELRITRHTVFLTYAQPAATLSSKQESLFMLACWNARGLTQEQQITPALWEEFTDRRVQRIDRKLLTYYRPYTNAAATTNGLIKTTNGQCYAWARLFVDMGKVHGRLFSMNMKLSFSMENTTILLMV